LIILSFFDFRVFVRKEEKQTKTNKNKQKQAKKRERTKNKQMQLLRCKNISICWNDKRCTDC